MPSASLLREASSKDADYAAAMVTLEEAEREVPKYMHQAAANCYVVDPENAERCLRCRRRKYLSNFQCVDACDRGLFGLAAQSSQDSPYGRACCSCCTLLGSGNA